MLKKAMIQFISALTLILGTVFPSTSALATTSVEPVAINSARLVTSDDQVIGDRVKSGTDANLQLQVTLSPRPVILTGGGFKFGCLKNS